MQRRCHCAGTEKKGGWGWFSWGKSPKPNDPVPFAWPDGMKLPSGSQSADGASLEGALPQADGSVLLPDGSIIAASAVVLPDGTTLSDVAAAAATGEAPTPAAIMPDGSKPKANEGGSLGLPTVGKPSMPGLPSFAWPEGMKLPSGSQSTDGASLEGALPQADGSVLMYDGSTISASSVVLPDGVTLSDLTAAAATGEAPTPAATMPDGAKPAKTDAWRLPSWGEPSLPGLSAAGAAAAGGLAAAAGSGGGSKLGDPFFTPTGSADSYPRVKSGTATAWPGVDAGAGAGAHPHLLHPCSCLNVLHPGM